MTAYLLLITKCSHSRQQTQITSERSDPFLRDPNSIRPQHVLELVIHSDTGPALLSSLTNFINILLREDCPEKVWPVLFKGTLLALRKKTVSLQPIAISYYWRCLAAKCANSSAISQVADRIAPFQLSIGTPGRCEAAVHSARHFLDTLGSDSALVKLDITNALNRLSCSAMPRALLSAMPSIYPYCHAANVKTSTLMFGQFNLL